MGRYSVKTRLSSEEAISEAKVYFGEGGLGLVATGESSCHATLTGADGYVTVTAGEEGDKTNVELVEALRRRIAELEACNEDLGAFAHAVAHDLKAPLAVVLGFADMLKESYDEFPDEELERYLGLIAQSGRRMKNIIDELLPLA